MNKTSKIGIKTSKMGEKKCLLYEICTIFFTSVPFFLRFVPSSWNFLFLTKFRPRLAEILWPPLATACPSSLCPVSIVIYCIKLVKTNIKYNFFSHINCFLSDQQLIETSCKVYKRYSFIYGHHAKREKQRGFFSSVTFSAIACFYPLLRVPKHYI